MIKTKAFAFLTLSVLVLNLSSLALADTKRIAVKRQSNALAAMLPASDGVVTFDVKRFFNDALPRVLSSNQPMLEKILGHVGEIGNKTGIDLRKFQQVAAGFTMRSVANSRLDVDPVVIARGDFSADSLISTIKAVKDVKFREENLGDRIVLVFPAKNAAKQHIPVNVPANTDTVDRVISGMPEEIAVTTLDSSTLVIGSLDRVRQTIDRQTSVSAEVISLLSNSETAICTFAMRVPDGMAKIVDLDKDALGDNLNAIKFLSGSMDVTAIGASVGMTARTAKVEQARELFTMLDGMMKIGKAFLGNSKKTEQKVIGRMIENTKITNRGTDITLNINIPQSDIDLLVATIK